MEAEAIVGGVVGRVCRVDPGGALLVEYRNGALVVVRTEEADQFGVDDVILVTDDSIQSTDASLWLEESWPAIVKVKHPTRTVVTDQGGRWRFVPTTDVDYEVGNTVEVTSNGVVCVVQEEPIGFLDMESDESMLEQFRVLDPVEDTFDDFVGPPEVVALAKQLVEVPLVHHARLAAMKVPSMRGVLFTGPPGTGKTMLARIIAAHSGAEFLSVPSSAIFSKWYGESGRVLRLLFDHARKHGPSIIFFDEIDALGGQRNDRAHEESRRVVAQLLTLMDGFKPGHNVVVIAATNRVDDLDEALRRPGRFDIEIPFSAPTQGEREELLRRQERRYTVDGVLPHGWIAQQTDSWTGADLSVIWRHAAYMAALDERSVILPEDYLGGFERATATRRAHQVTGRESAL